jgi:hypothetical protein
MLGYVSPASDAPVNFTIIDGVGVIMKWAHSSWEIANLKREFRLVTTACVSRALYELTPQLYVSSISPNKRVIQFYLDLHGSQTAL